MRRIGYVVIALAAIAAMAAGKGRDVEDSYQWLEDVHGEKPLQWVKAENDKSLALLKSDPRYQGYYDAILQVLDATDRIPYAGLDRGMAYNYWQDAEHPKGVWRRTSLAEYRKPDPKWEILLDLDALAKAEGENWVWKGSSCSPDMSRCLLHLSRGGGDATVTREFDLTSRSFVKDGFFLPEAKQRVAFFDKDTVYVGTDFGPGSMTSSGYPRLVKLWKRGEALADAKTLLEGKDSDVAVAAFRAADGDTELPVLSRSPSFFESEYYLRDGDAWWKLPLPLDVEWHGLHKGQLLFTLRQDWTAPDGQTLLKGTLYAVPLADLQKTHALPKAVALYAPGPRASFAGATSSRDALYVSYLDNVVGGVKVYRFKGGAWSSKDVPLPAGGTAEIVSTDDHGPDVLLGFESFLQPPTLYADDGSDAPKPIKALPARFDASNIVTEQFEATSKDGTKIPYFVIRGKDAGAHSGEVGTGSPQKCATNCIQPRPTILYGYGGFEISMTPSYMASAGRTWLAGGGTYVIANIRGGGEFGPAWHEAALKLNRQRAFDDFEAVAADLSARGLTTPKQLGIMGGSNGGLLVSTVMTQTPELLGAVVCQVPLIDMIAYTHIGAGASWIAEYGDPAVPEERAAILKYSPYQNVSKDVKYPPVFFVTATSDDRVSPVHARKMAAKMLAQGHQVLFFENTDGGHAAAANHKQAAERSALAYVYLARMLGLAK